MTDAVACCAPSAGRVGDVKRQTTLSSSGPAPDQEMVELDGGRFEMGHDDDDGYPEDGEGPEHEVELAPFSMDATTVTNSLFGSFVSATGYVTEAERYGWSFVFAGLLPDDFPPTRGVAQTPWWRQVEGSDWRHPEGPHSSNEGRLDHPVVHVSWNDAAAYCDWSLTSLPTEAQWEYAARGGLAGKRYPWGDEREPAGEHLMNVWQGTFPSENTLDDGYLGTAPARSFPPNAHGLFNMTGNVWEWCSDWYQPDAYQSADLRDPCGPPSGTHRVMRGGSYLCHHSYCYRYRVAARSSNTPNSSAGNIGFRCVSGRVLDR